MAEGNPPFVALIIGVTGMASFALAEALMNPPPPPTAGPWKVYGVSRRLMPSWFPSSLLHHYITFDALHSESTAQNLSSISHEVTHVFSVAFQCFESEKLNVTMNSTMLTNVLKLLKPANHSSSLRHITLQTNTKHYIDPIFDPSLSCQLVHHEPPFREYSPRLPYPNFYYALEDLVASYSPSLTYLVHHFSIIIGASSRSIYNVLLTLSVYANICKHQGLPFKYPGNRYTWENFCDMSDVRVLAEQHIWAAVTDGAKNQAFNCSNGDVFLWKSMWEVLSEMFEVEFVAFEEKEEYDLAGMMKGKGHVWDEIVEKHEFTRQKWRKSLALKL